MAKRLSGANHFGFSILPRPMTEPWLFYLLWTILGSALGGLVRYGISSWISGRSGERFPAGTLVVNVSGAFLIGVVAALSWDELMTPGFAQSTRTFLTTGFLGGFTTVSSFSLQTLQLLQEGARTRAALNVILSLVLCLAAVTLGAAAGRWNL